MAGPGASVVPRLRGRSCLRAIARALAAVCLLLAAAMAYHAIGSIRRGGNVLQYTRPRPAMPSPNAFDYYKRAGEMVKAVPGQERAYAVDTPDAEVAALVARCRPALRIFREGTAYPYLTPLPANIYSAKYSYVNGHKALATMLAAEGRWAWCRSDASGALGSATDVLRLGADVARGGHLLHRVVSWLCERIGLTALAATAGLLDARQCRQAARQLAALEADRQPLGETLRAEHECNREFLAIAARTPGGLEFRGRPVPPMTAGGGSPWSLDFLTLAYDAARLDGLFQDMRRQAPLPAGKRRPVRVPDRGLVKPFLPAPDRVFVRHDAMLAQWRLLQTELALRAFHLEHARPAAALADLVPDYLPAIPQDPFGSGEPLRYRVGTKPAAYSVGPDGKDDGAGPFPGDGRSGPAAGRATWRCGWRPVPPRVAIPSLDRSVPRCYSASGRLGNDTKGRGALPGRPAVGERPGSSEPYAARSDAGSGRDGRTPPVSPGAPCAPEGIPWERGSPAGKRGRVSAGAARGERARGCAMCVRSARGVADGRWRVAVGRLRAFVARDLGRRATSTVRRLQGILSRPAKQSPIP